MNPEIKAEWVRRLRSGDYEQGRQFLNNDGKFCCLGVLMEMAVEAGICERMTHGENSITRYLDRRERPELLYWSGDSGTLTPDAAKWSQLYPAEQGELVKLNDRLRLSFTQIAYYIESQATWGDTE